MIDPEEKAAADGGGDKNGGKINMYVGVPCAQGNRQGRQALAECSSYPGRWRRGCDDRMPRSVRQVARILPAQRRADAAWRLDAFSPG